MSDFTVVAIMILMTYASVHTWFFVDRAIRRRGDAIATGIFGGIPVPAHHRKFEIFHSWAAANGGAVAYQTVTSIAWMELAQHVSEGGVKLLAYIIAGLAWLGVLVWVEQAIVGYVYLISRVRQADAD